MRLHTLRLRAFGPYAAEQVIDFDQLAHGGLFLLEGPTGAGKTTILKQIAQSIAANYPEAKLFVLLADERPEEVTDWQRSVQEAFVYPMAMARLGTPSSIIPL